MRVVTCHMCGSLVLAAVKWRHESWHETPDDTPPTFSEGVLVVTLSDHPDSLTVQGPSEQEYLADSDQVREG